MILKPLNVSYLNIVSKSSGIVFSKHLSAINNGEPFVSNKNLP